MLTYIFAPAVKPARIKLYLKSSYNVLFKNQDVDSTLAHIKQHNPDVLALHEYTTALAEKMHPALADSYPFYEVRNGRGFYSRIPVEAYEFVEMPKSFGGGGQKVLLNVDGRLVSVFSVHPSSPPAQTTKLPGLPVHLPLRVSDTSRHQTHMQTVLAEVAATSGPLVLVGDLNMTDQNPMYEALRHHLQDAFVEQGTGLGFTFTPFGNYPLPVWRIDYIMHSGELTAVDIKVGEFAGSDHKPLIATMSVSEADVPERIEQSEN